MLSEEGSFRRYLRQEVVNAGNSFEEAKVRFLTVTEESEIAPGPELIDATEALAEALRIYMGALRRLAHYSAHKARPVAEKQFLVHA